MKKAAALALLLLAGIMLAGCSLPGQAFPGGPSPWLPGGAPGAVYGAPAGTASAPATTPVPAETSSTPAAATGVGAEAEHPPNPGSASSGERRRISTPLSGRGFGKLPAFRYNTPLVSEPSNASHEMIASLLVVCTGNICRSPMAAALFSARAQEAGKPLEIASAGTAALSGHPPPSEAVELMAERGFDISGHRGQQFTEEIARGYDLILVMERGQQQYIESNWPMFKGRVHRLGDRRNGDVSDPYKGPKQAYRESLAQIEAGVEDWSGILLQ